MSKLKSEYKKIQTQIKIKERELEKLKDKSLQMAMDMRHHYHCGFCGLGFYNYAKMNEHYNKTPSHIIRRSFNRAVHWLNILERVERLNRDIN